MTKNSCQQCNRKEELYKVLIVSQTGTAIGSRFICMSCYMDNIFSIKENVKEEKKS